jgi:D-alanine-D-alanine ligase
LRAAVVEDGDALLVPAFIEYPTSDARPIREVADKLEIDGGAMRQSRRADAQPVCPAEVDPALAERLAEAARLAHRALGARDYSLFDFRVHRDTGEPHLLEAGLFWTFSELSAITKMLRGAGQDPVALTGKLWRAAAARGATQRRDAA